jgi:hypothetical protein
LKKYYEAEKHIENDKIPPKTREKWLPKFFTLLNQLNYILSLFDADNVKYTPQQAENGFNQTAINDNMYKYSVIFDGTGEDVAKLISFERAVHVCDALSDRIEHQYNLLGTTDRKYYTVKEIRAL